jgi:hypothetical protein
MLFHASTNVISSFIPTAQDVLGGFDDYMVLRGAVYWIMAIVILVLTKGRLGYNAGRQARETFVVQVGQTEAL